MSSRRREVALRRGRPSPSSAMISLQSLDALVADVDVGARDELLHLALGLVAERAAQRRRRRSSFIVVMRWSGPKPAGSRPLPSLAWR